MLLLYSLETYQIQLSEFGNWTNYCWRSETKLQICLSRWDWPSLKRVRGVELVSLSTWTALTRTLLRQQQLKLEKRKRKRKRKRKSSLIEAVICWNFNLSFTQSSKFESENRNSDVENCYVNKHIAYLGALFVCSIQTQIETPTDL